MHPALAVAVSTAAIPSAGWILILIGIIVGMILVLKLKG
jgi:hypothetical protein